MSGELLQGSIRFFGRTLKAILVDWPEIGQIEWKGGADAQHPKPIALLVSVACHACSVDFVWGGCAYLGAWFGADPRADFNGVNGLNTQDIFDYLAAWLAGC